MSCEACGGRGWVVILEPGSSGRARRCECFTNRPIEQRLLDAGVGPDLLHASWGTWEGKKPDLSSFPSPCSSLALLGKTGSGKSHVAVAVLRQWLIDGHRCRFIDVPDFLEKIKDRFGTDESPQEFIQREALREDLLVLDEAYTQQETPWADATLSRMIRWRLREFKPTIITTNLTEDELARVEPRVARRLAGNLIVPLAQRKARR